MSRVFPARQAGEEAPGEPVNAFEELDPLASMIARYEQAVGVLGLEQGLDQILRRPEREIIVSIPIRRTTATSRYSPDIGWCITPRAVRAREGADSIATSARTRCGRWRPG
jgi:hypothetical protein